MQSLKTQIKPEDYLIFLNLFKTFLGIDLNDSKHLAFFKESNVYITEDQIITNMSNVFGYKFDFFGKLIYLYISKGFDRSKISISRFINALMPLMNGDVSSSHNKIAFKLYDVDRDEQLNILNLLTL